MNVPAVAVGCAVLAAISGLIVLAGTRPSRRLPEPVCAQIAALPEDRRNHHVVDLELADGRLIEKVSIAYSKYIALVGGRMRNERYTASDVVRARLRK